VRDSAHGVLGGRRVHIRREPSSGSRFGFRLATTLVALTLVSLRVVATDPPEAQAVLADLQVLASSQSEYMVPTSIPADGSRAVENDIMQFLANVPDGSTVRFQPNGVYGQNLTIVVTDRKNLIIDGNGSTFKKLLPTDASRVNNANWRIVGGDGVTIQNMVVYGAFDPPPRGTAGQGFPSDHGIWVKGAQNAQIRDVRLFNIAGDFLACDPDTRQGGDYATAPPCRNVLVDGLHGEHAGRHGIAATHADGFTVQNSTIVDSQNEGIDLEIDVAGELMRNIRLLNNEFNGTFGPAIFVPFGSWPTVGGITIRGNKVLGAPDLCWPVIDIAGSTRDIFIQDNELRAKGDGIRLSNVASGEISGNAIENVLFGAACGSPPEHVPVRLTNSAVSEFNNSSTGFCPCSLFSPSATPSVVNLGGPVEVGVKFRADVTGAVRGVRFYKGAGDSGTHVANLWTQSGTHLRSATFDAETASGWQQANFASPVFLQAGRTYVASYHTDSGLVASTEDYFATSGVDVPPLHAPAATDDPNGVYSFGPSAFPLETSSASNYWVDVVFANVVAPRVTLRSPSAGFTNVSQDTKVTVSFSEPVAPTMSVTLTADLSRVPAALSYDPGTWTATLTPTSLLNPSTKYTVTLRDVVNESGFPMPEPVSWTFTTTGPTTTTTTTPTTTTTTTAPTTTTTTTPPGGGSPASVRAVASARSSSAATSLVVPVPAGVGAGQYLLAAVAVTNGREAINAPAGWTKLADAGLTGRADPHLATFSRFATADEPAFHRFSWATATGASGAIMALSGVHPATPLDGSPQGAASGFVTTPWTGPSITTTTADDLLVTCWTTQGAFSQSPDPAEVELFDTSGAGPTNTYLACDSSGPVGPGTHSRSVRTTAGNFGVTGAAQILAVRAATTMTATAGTTTTTTTTTTASTTTTTGPTTTTTTTTAPTTTTTTTPPGGGSPASVRAVASARSSSAATSLVVPVPAGVGAGQYLLAAVAVTNGREAINAPAGWTKLADAGLTGRADPHLATFSRFATADEPAFHRFSWATATGASGAIMALSGVHPATPLDGSPQGAASGFVTTPWTGPSITTTTADDLLVTCWTTQGAFSQSPDPAEVELFDTSGAGPTNTYLACDSSGPVGPGTHSRSVRTTAGNFGVTGAAQILAVRAATTTTATAGTTTTTTTTTTDRKSVV
jgi:hypothetical protein